MYASSVAELECRQIAHIVCTQGFQVSGSGGEPPTSDPELRDDCILSVRRRKIRDCGVRTVVGDPGLLRKLLDHVCVERRTARALCWTVLHRGRVHTLETYERARLWQ